MDKLGQDMYWWTLPGISLPDFLLSVDFQYRFF